MSPLRLASYTTLAMMAFAANSLLCRLALKSGSIDPASFTTVRLAAGAAMLWLMVHRRHASLRGHGSWRGALALFIYASAFSFAYITLSAGTGALLLFGAVQATMIMAGLLAGERLSGLQCAGLIASLIGGVILVLPGVETPTLAGSALMLTSGIAWGIYSLLGRGVTNPGAATAGNFLRAGPLAIMLSLLAWPWMRTDASGLLYAVLSGALASGLGYVIWYRVVREMRTLTASTVQLSVPILTAAGGIIMLDEALTTNYVAASVLILGGIWLVSRHGTQAT